MSNFIPSTTDRVPMHSPDFANEKIRWQTEKNVAHFAHATSEELQQRLEKLEAEWDIERVLEANAASLSLVGLALGATVNRKFFLFPAVIAGFLLQHAVQGWCPPIPILRRLGIRTAAEIDYERCALKALRGDFQNISENGTNEVHQALAAARK